MFYFEGGGKTHAFRQLEKAIDKTEETSPSTYLKPFVVNGKPTKCDMSSIITHTNHIGLREYLPSNNRILLNDDADLIAKTFGLYNVKDYTKEHQRNLILCGYDGLKERKNKTLMKNMKNWINYIGFDGSHNRFLYMSIPKLVYSPPQK